MDTRRLRLFLAVADHGGFTAGAEAVHVAQPAVSLAVRELERELEVDLFTRTPSGARLTPAGEALVGPARQALRDLEAASAAVAAVTGLVSGRLDIAAIPSLAADPVALLVGRFRREHPAVTLRLVHPADPVAVTEAVRSGVAEIGITEARFRRTLPGIMLADQELVAISPPGTADDGVPLPVERLAELPLVATLPGTSLRDLLVAALQDAGAEATVAVETEQRDALVPLVIAGAGTAVVPQHLADAAAALGATVRPLEPPLQRAVVLLHREGTISPAAAAFIALAELER